VSDLLQRIAKNVRDHRLFERGDMVLIAVSGGVDSMALLHLLRALSRMYHWKLTVAHFNHQLRGRSSNADEKLVRQTASAMRLPVVVGHADVRRFAEKSKLSIEMAARDLRHEFFARAAKQRGAREVALAHHADDQVELFFLRLLRGAGAEGLAGMKWRSPSPADGKVVLARPLLDVTRTELREFARANRISFREDATNALLAAPRNRIRNELLPLLRKKYQPGLAKTVLRLMEIVGAEADAVGEMARQWLRATGRDGPPGPPRKPQRGVPAFGDLPIAVQRRVLQWQLVESDVSAEFDLVERLRRSPDVLVSVSPGFSVARDAAGGLKLRAQTPVEFKTRQLKLKLAGRAGKVNFAGVQFHWKFQRGISAGRGSRRPGRELFDADKVGGKITLRHWRAGDRFQPIAMKSAVKLQDWFVNQKISRARRRELAVAAGATGVIFWVEGLRIGDHFKLTTQTKRCLVWHWVRSPAKSREIQTQESALHRGCE